MGRRKEKKQGTYEPDKKPGFSDPWIGKRTGLIIVAVVSVALVAFMAYILIPALDDPVEGLLWSLGFGASIWVVFGGFYAFNKYIRKL
jgi:hypothetical protein